MGSSNDDNAAPPAAPQIKTQPHLMPQDASQVDPTKLCALTPEVVRDSLVVHNSQRLLCY